MSTGLVVVLAVAAGWRRWWPLPAAAAGRAAGDRRRDRAGPGGARAGDRPDATVSAVALLGLSFLLFLAGSEVDLRRFRGTLGRRVAVSLTISWWPRRAWSRVLAALDVGGAVLIGVALLATSLGLVVPVLADAGALGAAGRPDRDRRGVGGRGGRGRAAVGRAGRGRHPARGPVLLLVLLLAALAAIGLAVAGVEHSMPLTALVARLADTSAQIRVRWTVLLVAGLALAAQALGFEAILGAFLAGMLVRALDPDPEHTHPLYPVKLDAVGYGLLVPVFFVTSGLTLDLRGLVEHPAALATVPAFLVALLVVRGLPALAFRRELPAAGAARHWRCCRRPRCRSSSPRRRSAGRWACSTRPSPRGSSRPASCRCWCSRRSRWPCCPGSREPVPS